MSEIEEIIGMALIMRGLSYGEESLTQSLAERAAAELVKALTEAGYEIAPRLTPDEAHRLICYRGGFTPIG